MAGLRRVRRLLLVNALIFAVLAAAVALAYYSYSYTTYQSSERELRLLQEVAEEKRLNIESLVADADKKLMRAIRLDELAKLGELSSGTAVLGVYVLDDQLKLVPDGSWSTQARTAKEAIAIRDWYLAQVIPRLSLQRQTVNERGHDFFDDNNGRRFLLSFMRRVSGDRTFYVVVEDDINHLLFYLFPEFFNFSENKQLYRVVDAQGGQVWGLPFESDPDSSIEVPFVDTVDGWVLRATLKDADTVVAELRRQKIINSALIGGAVTVIVTGLAFLAVAIRRERRSNELKSEFISNVSHELKTPLSIISMFGEMLANGRTKSPEQANEYAEIIWRESVRLGRLIDNVLDFAKIERGMGVYEFAEVDVGEVVERAIDLVGRRLAAAEMTLESSLEPELPLVKLDANAFTLAVLNLIDNATKYAADGKKIELSLTRERTTPDRDVGERIVLAVRDHGPGIAVEEQEQIFERFYRAKAVRLKPIRGSGIGLALVRHIARAHGGDVTVESSIGTGATFRLWLPIP
jgi:two-component system phosphate regulon sensor histidine kinase PhoR